MNTELTYEQRLESAREQALGTITDTRLASETAINDDLRRESISTLKAIVRAVAEITEHDEERLESAIKNIRRSEYGRVPELITKVASMYNWPIQDKSEAKEIDDRQEAILDMLKERFGARISHDLLLDIKEAKGFHSFLDDITFEVIEGVEPDYEELKYFLLTFASKANLPLVDFKLTEKVWNKNEDKALAKISLEEAAAAKALADHEELMNS